MELSGHHTAAQGGWPVSPVELTRPAAAGPRASATCLPGRHVCSWASQAAAVDQLTAQYVDEHISLRGLAQLYPWSRTAIARLLDVHGIDRRTRAQQRSRSLDLALIAQQIDNGASLLDLAKKHHISRQQLGKRLARFRQQGVA